MRKNRNPKLPRFHSVQDLVEFFDTHDLGRCWDSLQEADFEINLKTRRHVFGIEDKVARKLNEIARKKKIPSQVLIDTWLMERVSKEVA